MAEQSPAPPALPPSASVPTAVPLVGPTLDEGEGCTFPDHGFGAYEGFRPVDVPDRAGAAVRLLVPRTDSNADRSEFDLLIHFHGADPVRKLLAVENFPLVIAGVDAGTLSGHYARLFADAGALAPWIASIEAEVAKAYAVPKARARTVSLSSWSAGYGALGQLVTGDDKTFRAVVLIDSLHANWSPNDRGVVDPTTLAGFVSFARAAAERDDGPLFYMTHSQIHPRGYAATGDVASFFIETLRVPSEQPDDSAPLPDELALVRAHRSGRFFVRGYTGNSKEAHCAQLRLLPAILAEHLLPALRTQP